MSTGLAMLESSGSTRSVGQRGNGFQGLIRHYISNGQALKFFNFF
jgi:hypothetical protein